MSYCTVPDARRHCPDILPEDTSDSAVSFFIESAENEINDTLRSRYAVPFTATVPDSIRFLCARMAAYRILQSYPDRVMKEDLDRLMDGIRWELTQYARGTRALGSEYELGDPADGTYFVTTSRSETYTDYEVDI